MAGFFRQTYLLNISATQIIPVSGRHFRLYSSGVLDIADTSTQYPTIRFVKSNGDRSGAFPGFTCLDWIDVGFNFVGVEITNPYDVSPLVFNLGISSYPVLPRGGESLQCLYRATGTLTAGQAQVNIPIFAPPSALHTVIKRIDASFDSVGAETIADYIKIDVVKMDMSGQAFSSPVIISPRTALKVRASGTYPAMIPIRACMAPLSTYGLNVYVTGGTFTTNVGVNLVLWGE